MGNPPARSPRIERLERDLASGDGAALAAFWREIEAQGAPLVEPIGGEADRVLVTYVYRDEGRADVVAMPGFDMPRLSRLAGTDLWHRSVVLPAGVRTEYTFLLDPPAGDIYEMSPEALRALEGNESSVVDPWNPRTFQCGALAAAHSVLELPGAEPQPWVAERDLPRGKLEPHRFESDTLGGARVVWTYEPPGYDPDAAPYPVLVLHDGYSYANMPIQPTLDNLIAAGRIPPIVCALYQWADRIPELACDEAVADALAGDLLRRWLPGRLHVTGDPARTIVGGASLGGLAAVFTALHRPDAFGNVISQSGSFWWGPGTKMPADMHLPGIEWEWLTRRVREAVLPSMRLFLEVGVLETSLPGGRMPDMTASNRRMRDALLGAGHDVRYREFNGGHDFVCWRGSIADALIAIAGPWV